MTDQIWQSIQRKKYLWDKNILNAVARILLTTIKQLPDISWRLMWQDGELEASSAAGIHAGLCADIITVLTLHTEAELNEGTHCVFSAEEKHFHFFCDLYNLFELTF